MDAAHMPVGEVVALWRYPVKSMRGEELSSALVTERGLLGDRAYAILDRETGHIASAKHPRKWPNLLACRAAFAEPPRPGAPLPPVLVTLPDGAVVSSAEPDVDRALSRALGRDVSLIAEAPANPTREADRTPVESAVEGALIRQEALAVASPAGTFFDYAVLHLLTTATLERLRALYPAGRFETPRFRPNIVVRPRQGEPGFVEQTWLGEVCALGEAVRVRLIDPSPRCVITTLAQGDLPYDKGILRTVAQHSSAASVTLAPGVVLAGVAGVYASVSAAGELRRGDAVWVERGASGAPEAAL